MKKFELMKNTADVSEKNICEGCTLNFDWLYPECLKVFDNLEDARKELNNYLTEYKNSASTGKVNVTEYYIVENIYDEDGEFVSGGDIWDFSKYLND